MGRVCGAATHAVGWICRLRLAENYTASRLAAALIARIWRTKAASLAGKAASFRLPIRAKVSGLPPSAAVMVLLV